MNDRSHGNAITSSYECGNQTQLCTLDQALDESHGCHLHPKQCTKEACCTMAIEMEWIDPNVRTPHEDREDRPRSHAPVSTLSEEGHALCDRRSEFCLVFVIWPGVVRALKPACLR